MGPCRTGRDDARRRSDRRLGRDRRSRRHALGRGLGRPSRWSCRRPVDRQTPAGVGRRRQADRGGCQRLRGRPLPTIAQGPECGPRWQGRRHVADEYRRSAGDGSGRSRGIDRLADGRHPASQRVGRPRRRRGIAPADPQRLQRDLDGLREGHPLPLAEHGQPRLRPGRLVDPAGVSRPHRACLRGRPCSGRLRRRHGRGARHDQRLGRAPDATTGSRSSWALPT